MKKHTMMTTSASIAITLKVFGFGKNHLIRLTQKIVLCDFNYQKIQKKKIRNPLNSLVEVVKDYVLI